MGKAKVLPCKYHSTIWHDTVATSKYWHCAMS